MSSRNGRVESAELQKEYTTILPSMVSVEKVGKKGDMVLELDGIRFQIGAKVGEELLSALTRVVRPYAGFSIFDRIMQELDAVIDRLMSEDGTAEDDRDPGRAEAFCRSLALIRNPYDADWQAERERQMERYWKRNGADSDEADFDD
jgi:hypothetical protein